MSANRKAEDWLMTRKKPLTGCGTVFNVQQLEIHVCYKKSLLKTAPLRPTVCRAVNEST